MNSIFDLSEYSTFQRDRLAFIELLLYFMGELRRSDIVSRFGIQSAAASRDLAIYKKMAPSNIDYNTKEKNYVLGQAFKPLFQLSPERVLSWLAKSFGDGESTQLNSWLATDIPARLNQPSIDTLSVVTRAIHQRSILAIHYHSLSSGLTEREIIPFALIDNGQCWYVRAYDRHHQDFRDFVITRIQHPQLRKDSIIQPHELSEQDTQWTRIVELDLVPHPDRPRPEITELDYGMTDGHLRVRLRASSVGYVLRCWNVDCSADHHLNDSAIRLWLSDPLTLYGVKNAVLAPGYVPPTSQIRGRV